MNKNSLKVFESNFIVMLIGIIFIWIGGGYLLGLIKVNSMFVLAISLSGTCFVLSDFLNFIYNVYAEKQDKKNK